MAAIWQGASSHKEAIGSETFNRNQLLSRQKLVYGPARNFARQGGPRRVLEVLVVDDDEDTADGLARLARRWGHAVRLAHDGGIALQIAREQDPHVVLLDIQMPNIDGRQLATRLRLDLPAKECLIIAISGDADEQRGLQCRKAGIDLVLIKPVDPSVIETLLMLESERLNQWIGPARRCLEVEWPGMTRSRPPRASPARRHPSPS